MAGSILPRPYAAALAGAVIGLGLSLGASAQPTVAASFIGPEQMVYDTPTQGCEETDIPDQTPRAFRDDQGNVHLIASHSIVRAMVGPSLDSVRRDCRVIYRSPGDPDPAASLDRNWLSSPYTEDGRRVLSLMHSEYHGNLHPGRCPAAANATLAGRRRCWMNTITEAVSNDGGYSFSAPPPPANLVASLPYRYNPAIEKGPVGYHEPTNMVSFRGFVYAMFSAWPEAAQKFGACLMRSPTPFDAAAWRAWDGSGFNVRFADPYTAPVPNPEQHICTPIGSRVFNPDGLYVYAPAGGTFITMQSPADRRFGPPGVYLSASTDLLHWSKPALVASIESMAANEQPGRWEFGYFALLDPTAPDRNFATVASSPYIYYVRYDKAHGNYARALMRRQIRLQVSP